MRAVNLLPGDVSGDGRKAPPLPVLVGCVGTVLAAAVLAVMYLSASSQVGHQRRALADAQAEYAQIPAPAPPSPLTSKLPQEKQTRVAALANALGQRVAWDRLLREVSQVVPSDVWLVTLNALNPTLAPGAQSTSTTGGVLPQGFTVTGCTYSQPSVARFLARLDVVPDLSGMTLGKSSASGSGSSTSGGTSGAAASGGGGSQCPAGMFTFTLQGDVRTSGAAS